MLWEPINKNSLPGEVRSGFLDIIPFGLSRAYPSGLVSLSNVPSLERLFALWPVYNLSRALAIPNSSRELSETPDKLPAPLDALRIRLNSVERPRSPRGFPEALGELWLRSRLLHLGRIAPRIPVGAQIRPNFGLFQGNPRD